MRSQHSLGKWAESAALWFLDLRGYSFLAKNARTPYGELDLVMCDKRTIVFVEVKCRRSSTYGVPELGLTQAKQRHLYLAALTWAGPRGLLRGEYRFDLVAIGFSRNRVLFRLHQNLEFHLVT